MLKSIRTYYQRAGVPSTKPAIFPMYIVDDDRTKQNILGSYIVKGNRIQKDSIFSELGLDNEDRESIYNLMIDKQLGMEQIPVDISNLLSFLLKIPEYKHLYGLEFTGSTRVTLLFYENIFLEDMSRIKKYVEMNKPEGMMVLYKIREDIVDIDSLLDTDYKNLKFIRFLDLKVKTFFNSEEVLIKDNNNILTLLLNYKLIISNKLKIKFLSDNVIRTGLLEDSKVVISTNDCNISLGYDKVNNCIVFKSIQLDNMQLVSELLAISNAFNKLFKYLEEGFAPTAQDIFSELKNCLTSRYNVDSLVFNYTKNSIIIQEVNNLYSFTSVTLKGNTLTPKFSYSDFRRSNLLKFMQDINLLVLEYNHVLQNIKFLRREIGLNDKEYDIPSSFSMHAF